MTEPSEPSIWQLQVEAFAAHPEPQRAQWVEEAKAQVTLPVGTPEYWEAVYTLVRQRQEMSGAAD